MKVAFRLVIRCAMVLCCAFHAAPMVPASELAQQYTLGRGVDELFMEQTDDGGFVLAGTIDRSTHTRAWCMKVDEHGEIEWRGTYGDGVHWYVIRGLQAAQEGGAILAGTSTVVETDEAHGWVAKVAAGGRLEWEKRYSVGESDWINDVKMLESGELILTGGTVIGSSFDKVLDIERAEVWLMLMDASGTPLWSKAYVDAGEGRSLDSSKDGGFAIVTSGAVLRVDDHGEIIWHRKYDGPGLELFEGIRWASQGGYVVWGNTERAGAEDDGVVVKLDRSGNMQWQRRVGGQGIDRLHSLDQTDTGALVLAGMTFSFGTYYGPWLLKASGDGTILWERIYDRDTWSGSAEAVRACSDGEFLMAGVRNHKLMLAQCSSSGEVIACPLLDTKVQGDSAPIEMEVRDLTYRVASPVTASVPTHVRRFQLKARATPLCK